MEITSSFLLLGNLSLFSLLSEVVNETCQVLSFDPAAILIQLFIHLFERILADLEILV